MKAEYCVDYLSHRWDCDDLITTFRETRQQRQKYVINSTTCVLTKNEKRLKKSEQYKSLRFQNALWRSMSRHCTPKLGQSNQLIDPSTVSWQKESDITWLYGPMYTNSSSEMENRKIHTYNATQTIKPVLKKQSNVAQLLLPSCSDPIYSYFDTPCWSTPTSGFSSSRGSFSSVSSKSSAGVHFNPEIIEIEYQPEYPVCLQQQEPRFMNIEQDDEEDDALWSLLVQASLSLKSSSYTRIASFSKYLFYKQQKTSTTTALYPPSSNQNSLQLVILLVSTMKSVVSLTTTWLLYQSLSPLSWLTRKSSTAGQSKQQKGHLIIL